MLLTSAVRLPEVRTALKHCSAFLKRTVLVRLIPFTLGFNASSTLALITYNLLVSSITNAPNF